MKPFVKELASYVLIGVVCFGIGVGGYHGWRWYNQGPAKTVMDTTAHFVGVESQVVMYSTQWCPYCQQARAYFKANNIRYLERDIEQDDEQTRQLYSQIGQKGVPQIVIGNEILHGFDMALVSQSLTRHKLL